MGEWVKATARDGHNLSIYLATPATLATPGIVMLQEIFGVTQELIDLTDRFAAEGYRVAVPALYDRIEAGKVLPYADADSARTAKNQLRYDEIDADIQAATQLVDEGSGLVLLGYCWGGGLAYWMAQNHRVDAVVSYYGTNIAQYCESPATPSARCQFHFGLDDPMIDAAARAVVKDSCRPTDQFFEYEGAGHAFANVARPSFREKATELAQRRTLDFLQQTFVDGAAG